MILVILNLLKLLCSDETLVFHVSHVGRPVANLWLVTSELASCLRTDTHCGVLALQVLINVAVLFALECTVLRDLGRLGNASRIQVVFGAILSRCTHISQVIVSGDGRAAGLLSTLIEGAWKC